jgi:hypothetical protein
MASTLLDALPTTGGGRLPRLLSGHGSSHIYMVHVGAGWAMKNLDGWLDWALPAVIILTRTVLNSKLTGRMPLIISWVIAFGIQALVRALIFGTPVVASLIPAAGRVHPLHQLHDH